MRGDPWSLVIAWLSRDRDRALVSLGGCRRPLPTEGWVERRRSRHPVTERPLNRRPFRHGVGGSQGPGPWSSAAL